VADIRKAVVIGAGISGLACAFRLQQLGIRALILESSAKAGGVISTVRRTAFCLNPVRSVLDFQNLCGR